MTSLDRWTVPTRLAVACAALVVAAVAVSVVHVARPGSARLDGRVDAVLVHASSESRLEAGMALVDNGVGEALATTGSARRWRSPTSARTGGRRGR